MQGRGAPSEATTDERTRRETSVSPSHGRGPVLALAAVVLGAAILYASAAQLVSTPRAHPDELIYSLAGASLADGHGLRVRGDGYEYGPLYPAILATILSVVPDKESAYAVFRAANALLFALSAVPIYLVARRLLSRWWSVLVAAMSVAIPSSMYVSLLLTESTAYLAYSISVYAIVLALERPSVARQLLVVAAVALAYATRAQFAVLFAAYLAGLALAWAIAPTRPRFRDALARLWPSLGVLGIGAAVLIARPLVTGSSPLDFAGAYEVLFRSYNPFDIAKWAAYHVADLELYLAVVPLAVSPIVLTRLWRRARVGSEHVSAFLSAFLALNTSMLVVTAAFASTEFGFDRLHDRNVFYLVPLWLIVFVVWLADGLPRPLLATATGVGLALVLPAILPFRQLANEAGIDTVPGALWVWIEAQVAGPGPLSGSRLLAAFVIALLAAAIFLPRRFRLALPAAVLAVFMVTGALAWDRMVGAPEDAVFAGGLERAWIDDLLPKDAVVTKLYIESKRCPTSALTRHALFLTEFFNSTVDRAAYIGDSVPDGLPIQRVDVGPHGVLRLSSGDSLTADYVYTQPGIELRGRRLADGTAAGLVLWRVDAPVTVVGASTNEDVRTADCR